VVFIRRDYLVDQMKRTVVHEGARTGDYLIVAMKSRSMFHFKGDTFVA
jgi:hypothetical protein